ncbi:hypothetical protein SCG7086_CP_00030, partial [Chlamydiales bacterium SCGC AG-110-P3]
KAEEQWSSDWGIISYLSNSIASLFQSPPDLIDDPRIIARAIDDEVLQELKNQRDTVDNAPAYQKLDVIRRQIDQCENLRVTLLNHDNQVLTPLNTGELDDQQLVLHANYCPQEEKKSVLEKVNSQLNALKKKAFTEWNRTLSEVESIKLTDGDGAIQRIYDREFNSIVVKDTISKIEQGTLFEEFRTVFEMLGKSNEYNDLVEGSKGELLDEFKNLLSANELLADQSLPELTADIRKKVSDFAAKVCGDESPKDIKRLEKIFNLISEAKMEERFLTKRIERYGNQAKNDARKVIEVEEALHKEFWGDRLEIIKEKVDTIKFPPHNSILASVYYEISPDILTTSAESFDAVIIGVNSAIASSKRRSFSSVKEVIDNQLKAASLSDLPVEETVTSGMKDLIDVSKGDKLEFEYEQGQFDSQDIFHEGVCAALAYRWLRYLLKYPSKKINSSSQVDLDRELGQDYNVKPEDRVLQARYGMELEKGGHSTVESGAVPKSVTQKHGLEYQSLFATEGLPDTMAWLISELTNTDIVEGEMSNHPESLAAAGGLVSVGISGAEGGHAVLMQIDPSREMYRFLDPNYGMVRFRSKERMMEFMNTFMETAYPGWAPYSAGVYQPTGKGIRAGLDEDRYFDQ